MSRPWAIATPDAAVVHRIALGAGVSPLVATLLVNRGVVASDDAQRFLDPRLADLPDPYLMKGMRAAVERILAAIRDDEPITVWGDYDVDGVTSVSLLVLFLGELGVRPRFFIPDRFRDGYGMNAERVEELARAGTRLIIAVDCGISEAEVIARASELGVDVIVVDHHRLPEALPQCAAVLNPLQADCPFPFNGLAACGLVFYLLIALRTALRERGVFQRLPEPDLRRYLDIVGIGTIADMVPLVGANRTLAVRGLQELSRSTRPGLVALVEAAGIEQRRCDGVTVGFQIGPRLNAMGRIGNARSAVELLTAPDLETARAIAVRIEQANRRRRDVQARILDEAIALVDGDEALRAAPVMVLASDDWHPGVMGIVAAKVVERYHRPAVLIAMADGVGRGSGRSVPGFDLFGALSACGAHLEAWGGHAAAGGVTVRHENVAPFRAALAAYAVGLNGDPAAAESGATVGGTPPSLRIDAELPLSGVDLALVGEIETIGPFGSENPEPVFCAQRVTVVGARVVRDAHVQLQLRQDGVVRPAMGWHMAWRAPAVGETLDVAFRPEVERWRGEGTARLRIVDLRPA